MDNSIYRNPLEKLTIFILAFGTLIALSYSIWVIGFRVEPQYDIAISSWALITLLLMAVILGGILVFQKSIDHRIRRGWIFIILAVITKLIGESLSYFLSASPGVNSPSLLSDFFLLLYYPLFFVGILAFPYKPLRRQDYLLFLLDLAIIMVTAAMMFWYFIFIPIASSQDTGLIKYLNMAYPTGDLILLAGLVVINQREIYNVSRSSLIFLVFSMILASIPDALFSYMQSNNIRTPLSNLNIFWLASVLCLIYAVARQIAAPHFILIQDTPEPESNPKLHRLVPLYLAAAMGPVLLVGLLRPNAICEPQFGGLLEGVVVLIVLVFARQHVVLMDNYHLYKFNRKLATIDGLTKAYNRQYFNDIFQQLVEEAQHSEKPLSVLLIDVDGFKSVNDTYGHLIGDTVLRTIADVLASQIRQSDILARYGGDEFAIILKETNLEGAQTVAKKIHHAMENQTIENKTLSDSVGEAELTKEKSPKRLLEEADQNLYLQKAEKSIKR